MTKREALLDKCRTSPRNIRFEELRRLLEWYGFQWRNPGGSHYIFWHPLLPPDLQRSIPKPHRGPYVKPVYVKQALQLIDDLLDRVDQGGGTVEGG